MRHCLLLTAMLFSCILASCTAKESSRLPNINALQSSIIRLAKAAPNFSQEAESLWAFGVADSIAKSITLQKDEEAKDLVSAYKALSHVAYGLNYGAYPLLADRFPNATIYLTKAILCIVDKNDKTCTFGMDLHLIELKSDQGFALFMENIGMDDRAVADNMQRFYEDNGADAFKTFQLQNRSFFFAYCQAIIHLTNDDDAETIYKKIGDIAEQLDSMPKEVSTEAEYYEVFNKLIGARAELINLMAMNLEHNKRTWPQQ